MKKLVVGLVFVTLCAVPQLAQATGKIRSVDVYDPDGIHTFPNANNALKAGDTVYIRFRLVNLGWAETSSNPAYTNPWQFMYTGPLTGDTTLDEQTQNTAPRPRLGLWIGERVREAECVNFPLGVASDWLSDRLDGEKHYTDLIFAYTIQAGDLALPIQLANATGTGPITNGGAYYLKNDGQDVPWALKDSQTASVTADFAFGPVYLYDDPDFAGEDLMKWERVSSATYENRDLDLSGAALGNGYARDLIWVGGAAGDDKWKWDLTTLNWRVAGDETETPVAFEAGDNVLFDDTAQSFYVVMEKVDAVNTYQYDIGNVVFSNEVNNYGWKCFTDTWTEARGHMGTIDKWGAGTLTIQTRLDTPKDFTCHEGKIISEAGSWWISEYRSTLGSLHDARKITFMPGTILQVDHDALLGGPGTAGRVNALFNGVDVLLRYKQCFNTVTFSNCPSFYANSGPILVYGTLYLRGHGLAPHVFAGAGYDLTFQSSLTPTSTIYVDDLTGDGVTVDNKDDLIVSNKLGTVNASGNNGSTFRGNSSFRKAGKGTMVLSNSSYSSATGDIVVVEGKLVMNGVTAGLSMTGSNWVNAAFGAVAGTRTRTITVQRDAELEFRRSSTTGPYNTPQEWRLVVDGGTLTLANRATTGFGTLELNNATFNYALGEGSGWFPSWGLFSVAQKLAFKGSTPYDLVQTPYSDWRDCPYITLGFTLSCPRDDEPIDPGKPMLTNLWNVVDFEVDDITGDSGTDATIRLPIRDMVNMSYTSYANPQINGYTYNPWQWCRFRGGIRKTGAGTLCLNGGITYTHTTEVAGGALLVDSSIATSSGVTVDSGAWLGGTGTVSAVTVKDDGGFICYAGRNTANVLRVPSLTAEGDVVVRVANPDGRDTTDFRQPVLQLTAKPASVDFRNWRVSYEGDEDHWRSFSFRYDSGTGLVSAFYSGGTMVIFR